MNARTAMTSFRGSRGGARRRGPVYVDLAIAIAVCVLGYRFGAGFLQESEARWIVAVLRRFGVDEVSGVVPRHILIFPGDRDPILAEVTASCSAALSILGLTALALTVLRRRRHHTVAGLVVAVVALLALNHMRLLGSTLAGLWWGDDALVLFHDWVGTLWSLATTLLGFLLLVWITLPGSERAEQDVDGRHTARRPVTWARPGLGYRMEEVDLGVRRRAITATGLLHRHVLPRWLSGRLAARREAARIDYRIGHLPPDERVRRIHALAADGLAAHAASLLAVATYEEDPVVLDGLAAAVATRQWEPVTGPDVAAMRLWARAWLLARTLPASSPPPACLDPVRADEQAPRDVAPPQRPPSEDRRPRTFARPPLPTPTAVPTRQEELR